MASNTRPILFKEYADHITRYISSVTGKDYDQVHEFVKNKVLTLKQSENITYLDTTSAGNIVCKSDDLWSFLKNIRDKIITPSGSIYYPTNVKKALITQMVDDKLKERKVIKKKQLEAEAVGDKLTAKECHQAQATVKIFCNAIPGGFGSPYNVLYDKGGYNAITSVARAMIGRAITTTEQLLGGNFSWFSEDELINYIIIMTKSCPSEDMIINMISKYQLKTPSKEELSSFYYKTIKNYVPTINMNNINSLIRTLPQYQVSFLFYYCNLRHIMWYNENIFRNYFKDLFSLEKLVIKEDEIKPSSIYNVDEFILSFVTVAFADQFEGLSIKKIVEERIDIAKKLLAIVDLVSPKLKSLNELFDVFVNNETEIARIDLKPLTRRNTVVISDTDSVIFTAKGWDKWYNGQDHFEISKESYQITAYGIYVLSNVVKSALRRFSKKHLVAEDSLGILAMKNEFLYPSLIIFPLKKTYAGLITMQEGVMLSKPKEDIKGQQLRGSTVCKESLDFTKDVLVNKILFPSMQHQISAIDMINNVVAYELKIKESVLINGKTDYCQLASIKKESDYKDPESTGQVIAHQLWETVFAKKYGHVSVPSKTYTIPLLSSLPPNYYEDLNTMSRGLGNKFKDFVEKNGGLPSSILINPQLETIPVELRPIIDVRSIIYSNIKPTYVVLDVLGIALGYKKDKVLLSDIY